jgi:hypothetical protein
MVEYLKDVKDRKTNEIKQEWVFVGYYESLVSALKGVLKKYSREVVNEASDLDNAVKRLENLVANIELNYKGVEYDCKADID